MNGIKLEVSANADYAITQTFIRHGYYPGRACQPEFTYVNLAPEDGVVKRVGYFSASTVAPYSADRDGAYLESADGKISLVIIKNGTVHESQAPDAMDMGVWKNFNVTLFDFLYLGGTSLTWYQILNGQRDFFLRYNHSGNVADTIFNHPSQPLRAEVRSTGGAGDMTFVCGNVNTMGAGIDGFGTPANIDSGNAYISCNSAGTEYPLLGVKKNDPTADFVIKGVSVSASAGAAEILRWRLLLNPTLSSALSYSAVTNSYIDKAAGDGTITVTSEGYCIAAGNGGARSGNTANISRALRLGMSIAGVYDEIILAVTPLDSTQKYHAVLDGEIV